MRIFEDVVIGRIRQLQRAIRHGGRSTSKHHRTIKVTTDKATNIISMTDSATQMTHVADKSTETAMAPEQLHAVGKHALPKKKMYIEET